MWCIVKPTEQIKKKKLLSINLVPVKFIDTLYVDTSVKSIAIFYTVVISDNFCNFYVHVCAFYMSNGVLFELNFFVLFGERFAEEY